MRAVCWTREPDAYEQHAAIHAAIEDDAGEIAVAVNLAGDAPQEKHAEGLASVADWAGRGQVDKVYVLSLDRLSRLGAADTIRALEPILQHGGRVVSIDEPWLGSFAASPQGLKILLAIAEWGERQASIKRAEAARLGLCRARDRGLRIARPALNGG